MTAPRRQANLPRMATQVRGPALVPGQQKFFFCYTRKTSPMASVISMTGIAVVLFRDHVLAHIKKTG